LPANPHYREFKRSGRAKNRTTEYPPQAEVDEEGRGIFIFHFPYYICHLPLPEPNGEAMANDKCNMENGK
jgi:hypothetical protein